MRAMLFEIDRPAVAAGGGPGAVARAWAGAGEGPRVRSSAGPTCTWSTVNCHAPSCRSYRGIRSWARWTPSVRWGPMARRRARSRWETWWAYPGWAGPAAAAATASAGARTCATQAKFTGYDLDGGFAEYAVVDRRFAFPIPAGYPPVQAAPLLCAGLIGYRSLNMTGEAERLGIYGYGAAAHIVTQVARHQGRRVFAFTRPGDTTSQEFAREMGAEWAGDTAEEPPEELDAAIIFAPAGDLVPLALAGRGQGRGGRVRGHPHERHPLVPVRHALGGAGGAFGGQSHPARRPGVPCLGSLGCRSVPRSSCSLWRGRTRPLRVYGRGKSGEQQSW